MADSPTFLAMHPWLPRSACTGEALNESMGSSTLEPFMARVAVSR